MLNFSSSGASVAFKLPVNIFSMYLFSVSKMSSLKYSGTYRKKINWSQSIMSCNCFEFELIRFSKAILMLTICHFVDSPLEKCWFSFLQESDVCNQLHTEIAVKKNHVYVCYTKMFVPNCILNESRECKTKPAHIFNK